MLLINNAKVMTMENRIEYDRGYVLIDNSENSGKIVAVGSGDGLDLNGDPCEIIDACGGYLLPGLIDPHCHIGLWQDGQRPETGDGNEMTDPCTPQLRAIDAINPHDPCFREAVEAGITSVMTGPGSANVIAGTFAFIKTYGNNIDKMTVSANAAMKAALGENPKGVYGSRNNAPGTRMGNAAVLRENLIKAGAYLKSKEKHETDEKIAEPEYNFKYESLIPVLEKKMILKIHGHRADDLLTAIRICKEFDLIYTLDHCTEGYLIAEHLVEEFNSGRLCGVLTGPLLSDRSKPELANQSIRNPGILAGKDIPTAILTDHPVIPIQYLAVTAAVASREGMDEYAALEAITSKAALLCGVSERVGSIKAGKDADLVIMDGHPFDFRAKVKHTLIDGKVRYSYNGSPR
ncbi:MAG: amidohydrolase [Eubacteriales bacterium]|nr:amidohydrolase [Eubacteriales bacterium]